MAEILSQDEVDQLLAAIDPGGGKESLKKRSRGKSKTLLQKENDDLSKVLSQKSKILSQKEIENLLNLITGAKTGANNRNKTMYKLEKNKRDGELSQEEIDMLLNPINNDKK
jgi:flagellar motor switch protein FliM